MEERDLTRSKFGNELVRKKTTECISGVRRLPSLFPPLWQRPLEPHAMTAAPSEFFSAERSIPMCNLKYFHSTDSHLPGYFLSHHPSRSSASTINGNPSDVAPSALGNWSPDCRQQICFSDGENVNDGSRTESATSADTSQVDILDTGQTRSLSSS